MRCLVWLGAAVICFSSCQLNRMANSHSSVAVTNYAKGYYFVMDDARQEELLHKLSQFKLGDSRTKVIASLGAPSDDRKILTKESGEFRGHLVTYYVKIWEKDLANEKHDRFVKLRFDTNDHLVKIIRKVDASE